jgi:hypothetical protein
VQRPQRRARQRVFDGRMGLGHVVSLSKKNGRAILKIPL